MTGSTDAEARRGDDDVGGRSLVLFDGECAVCDASVMFIIDHDPEARFAFAPLQSALGKSLLRAHARDLGGDLDSLILIEGGVAYAHSTAVLRIARKLQSPVRWAWLLVGLPRVLRDPLYRAFAARRKRWFGKLDACRVPTPELRARFLA